MKTKVIEPFEFLNAVIDRIDLKHETIDSENQQVKVCDLYSAGSLIYRDKAYLEMPEVQELSEEYVMELTVAELDELGILLGIELSGLKADKQQQILAAL
jgi:hypothetical protein